MIILAINKQIVRKRPKKRVPAREIEAVLMGEPVSFNTNKVIFLSMVWR